MSIEEGNKLIAEFMGEVGLTKVKDDKIVPYDKKYDTLWNNLMPVVEKIKSIYNTLDLEIKMWGDKQLIIFSLYIFADLNTVWKAVVQFIQWYNKQKQ